MRALAAADLPCLTSLHLVTNFITPAGVRSLVAFLKRNPNTLQELCLDANPLGPEGVRILCEEGVASYCGHSLGRLTIGDTRVDDTACSSIRKMLQHSNVTALNTLCLAVNDIRKDGLDALCEGCHRCPNLTHLDVGGNPVGDQAFTEIFTKGKVGRIRFLRVLDLVCTEMLETGGAALFAALDASPQPLRLRNLKVDANKISDTLGVALVDWAKSNDRGASLPPGSKRDKEKISNGGNDRCPLGPYPYATLFFFFGAAVLGLVWSHKKLSKS